MTVATMKLRRRFFMSQTLTTKELQTGIVYPAATDQSKDDVSVSRTPVHTYKNEMTVNETLSYRKWNFCQGRISYGMHNLPSIYLFIRLVIIIFFASGKSPLLSM